jgi:hypothetical protein
MTQSAGKKSERPMEGPPGAVQGASPEIDWSSEPVPVHANFASIGSSEEEFALVFGATSPSGKKTSDGRNLGRIVSSVRVSPSTFYKVLTVMVNLWNRWVEREGGPKDAPRFVQVSREGGDKP